MLCSGLEGWAQGVKSLFLAFERRGLQAPGVIGPGALKEERQRQVCATSDEGVPRAIECKRKERYDGDGRIGMPPL
jgi:hypothetical protein